MKMLILILPSIFVLTIVLSGCGSSGKKTTAKNNVNHSEKVAALVDDTVKIYEDYAKQLESNLKSGAKAGEILEGIKSISDRYQSRVKVEIESEFESMETEEIRAYYFAIAGQQVEREDLVDPRIKEVVEKLRNLSGEPPMKEHVKGYVIQFLNRCSGNASSAIIDSKNSSS